MAIIPKIVNPEDRFYIRDFFWNYPQKVLKVYKTNRILTVLFLVFFTSLIAWIILKTDSFVKSFAPQNDNTLVEATVGRLGTLNPLFASQNNIDRDIDELIYQRLIYIDQSGSPLPGIAESWETITPGKHYIFHINQQLRWSDGEELTADDVIFTFDEAASLDGSGLGDSIGSNLKGIKVEKVDDYSVDIALSEVNSSIFETLSIFIVPEHVLNDIKDEDYLKYGVILTPIGSGPYRVRAITDSYILLEANPQSLETPKIKKIKYMTFPSIQALEIDFRNNLIDSVTGIPLSQIDFIDEYPDYDKYSVLIYPRKKVLFLNLRDKLIEKKDLRIAIAKAINKDNLVSADGKLGKKAFSPIPSNSWAFNKSSDLQKYSPKEAKSKVSGLGYKLNKDGFFEDEKGNALELRLTYLDTEQNRQVVDQVQKDLKNIGVKVLLDPQSYDSILNETVATRNYQMLLFEVETTIDPDQYSLWHSSKIKYPDLNLSGYNFGTVDLLLERSRITLNKNNRRSDYQLVQRYLSLDVPAVFLYEPYYNYIVRSSLKVVGLDKINLPSDRFRYISEWEFR